jgi:hypothetical protein
MRYLLVLLVLFSLSGCNEDATRRDCIKRMTEAMSIESNTKTLIGSDIKYRPLTDEDRKWIMQSCEGKKDGK